MAWTFTEEAEEARVNQREGPLRDIMGKIK